MFHLLFFVVICVSSSTFTAGSPGSSRPKATGRIVGGVDADLRAFPYQITIQRNEYWHSCGGSIISPRCVVTAAHCVPTGDPTDLSIRAGSAISGEGGQLVKIKSILVHGDYKPAQSYQNDIALLFLEEDLKFNEVVQAIPLCEHTSEAGSIADISGWGRLSASGGSPDVLQRTQVRVLNLDECSKAYKGRIFPGMICAAAPGRDACQGDSGGPMAVNKCLSGVVSWGTGCAEAGFPGVYTDVAAFNEWVKNNMK